MTENLDHHRSSSMGFRIVHPSTKKELKARRQALAAYCQNGAAISGFAQMFWTLAVGLQFKDSELIQVFNSCLDYPLFSEEMTELKTLGYWGFVDYLSYRFRVAQVIVNSEPSAKMATRPDSPASMGLMPEPSAFTDATSVFPVVVNRATEVCKATPRLTILVSKLAETPLMSV